MSEENVHIGPTPGPPLGPSKPRKRKTGLYITVAALASLTLLAGGGVLAWVVAAKLPIDDVATAVTQSPLEAAREKCAVASPYILLGDGGATLTIETEGEESNGASYAEMTCVLRELEVTDAIRSEIGTTRALDGKQTGDWGRYHASWSYHPDSGLNLIVTMR